MNLDRANTPAGEEYATVYVAFELSKAKWRLGIILPGAKKMSRYTIDGGDTAGLSVRLSQARAKAASYGKPVRILSCYEAGFDGHAPLVGGSGGDRLRGRSVEYRGEPSGAARQDRSDRSGQIDADVPRLYKGRTAGLQHAACADGGRRRPQTADARAGAPAPGAHGTQQSLEKTNTAELRAAVPGSAEAKVIQLADLKGIGLTSGQKLVNEVFYRSF